MSHVCYFMYIFSIELWTYYCRVFFNSKLFLKIKKKIIKELKWLIMSYLIYLPKLKKYGCVYRRNNKVMIHNISILIYYFLMIRYIFLFLKILNLLINSIQNVTWFEVHAYNWKNL